MRSALDRLAAVIGPDARVHWREVDGDHLVWVTWPGGRVESGEGRSAMAAVDALLKRTTWAKG